MPRFLHPENAKYRNIQFCVAATEDAARYDQRGQIERLATRFDAELAAEKIAHCYRMLHWIESNVNEKLVFEQLLLNIADADTMPVSR